ncbi:glycosyltransferase [Fusobacterium sp.]|uniref:glycosyltransferase n=1 Tax=Fusobacterium sp. TaxID=68766 RepID=UPI0025C0C1F0|nr:glycosyltransferase [Fusobacterium sp.]
MKILHIVECFGGGVYDFIKNITSEMIEDEVTILYGDRGSLKKDFKKDFDDNIKFIKWNNAQRELSLSKDSKALIELIKVLKKEKYDVIHLHSSKAGFLGRIGARIVKQQNNVIYTTHGISFLRKDISNFKLKLFILFEKIGKCCGGKVIACSKSEAEYIKSKGIQCDYINNGIRIEENFEKKIKQDDITRIITVGRITEQKGPVEFNKIAESFLENKKIKFIWVGDGEEKNKLTSPNIEITGWLEQEEVKEKLKEADIYLSTSLWEGLPLAVLQAMNYKLPLVLSNCVGNIDLVSEGVNGYLFSDYKEAIVFCKENEKNLKRGEFSKIILKEFFEIDRMKKKYKKIYDNCIVIGEF